jgi:hypothetical protein
MYTSSRCALGYNINKPGGDRVHICVMDLKWGIRVWYM